MHPLSSVTRKFFSMRLLWSNSRGKVKPHVGVTSSPCARFTARPPRWRFPLQNGFCLCGLFKKENVVDSALSVLINTPFGTSLQIPQLVVITLKWVTMVFEQGRSPFWLQLIKRTHTHKSFYWILKQMVEIQIQYLLVFMVLYSSKYVSARTLRWILKELVWKCIYHTQLLTVDHWRNT